MLRLPKQKSRRAPRGGPASIAAIDRVLFSTPLKKSLVPIKGPIVPQVEVKYSDLAKASYAADLTGTITPLNLIAEGLDDTQRVGRQSTMLAVALNGFCVSTLTTGQIQEHRVLLVWDNATDGVLPAITDVLSASDTLSFPNVQNINRFTILWDQRFILGPNAASFIWQPLQKFEVVIPLNSATHFSGTTAAIGSMQNGTIYAITLGSNAAGTAAGTVTYSSRVSFLDE